MDVCAFLYSPPLYQLSYQRPVALRGEYMIDPTWRGVAARARAWLFSLYRAGCGRTLRLPATNDGVQYNAPTDAHPPLVAQLVERWTVGVRAGIHRSMVQIRPGGRFVSLTFAQVTFG